MSEWGPSDEEFDALVERERKMRGYGLTTSSSVVELRLSRVNGPTITPPKPEITARMQWVDTAKWDSEDTPRRKWAIHERVPLRQVALFSGEGSIGKSIVELMCSVAHVTGKDWLGALPEPGGAFYISCEDDEEELRIRLAPIVRHYGTTFTELKTDGFRFVSLANADPILAAPNRSTGIIEPTERYRLLYEEAGDLKPKHIGIDTAADVFAGNENDRVQTRQFISL